MNRRKFLKTTGAFIGSLTAFPFIKNLFNLKEDRVTVYEIARFTPYGINIGEIITVYPSGEILRIVSIGHNSMTVERGF